MDSQRKVVSDVISMVRSENLDDRIPVRLALSTLKDKVRVVIKQDADSRRLFTLSEQWKRIPCLHLKEVTFQECGFDIPGAETMMRSTHKLPSTFQSAYGEMIKIFTINGLKQFIRTTLSGYIDIKNREMVDPSIKYFILVDGYVFVPDSSVEEVMPYGLFEYPEQATALTDPDSCLHPLDEPFPCPSYLLDPVKKDTKIELLKMFRGVVLDEKPNLDTNEKK